MSLVITIVSPNEKLLRKNLKIISEIILQKKISIYNKVFLGKLAIDIYLQLEKSNLKEINKIIQQNHHILLNDSDICIQDNLNRKKKLFACDMDKTAISQESINLIAKKLNIEKKMKKLTEEAMQGKESFKESIIKRTKFLKGVTLDTLDNILKHDITITPGIDIVVKTMNKFGSHTMLVSGGYSYIANKIGKIIGFKEIISNQLSYTNNILDGSIRGQIVDGNQKLISIKNRVDSMNLSKNDVLAIGDGANDVNMITAAHVGIGIRGVEG